MCSPQKRNATIENLSSKVHASHLSALRYFDLDLGSVVCSRRHVLDLPHDEETVNDATENDVFLVEEVAFCAGDEKLETEQNTS